MIVFKNASRIPNLLVKKVVHGQEIRDLGESSIDHSRGVLFLYTLFCQSPVLFFPHWKCVSSLAAVG